MRKIPFFSVLALALLPVSCLEINMKDPDKVLKANDFAVPADVEVGVVEYRLPVTSNMSWTAEVENCPGWISAQGLEHINPTGVSDSCSVCFSFGRNDSYDARTATLVFHAKGLPEKRVVMTQNGKNDRIRIDSAPIIEVEAEPSDPIELKVLSNVEWSAYVEEGATAGVTLDPDYGSGDGTIKVKFSPNYEISEEKKAVIVVTAPGLEPQKVSFVQKKNVPFLRLYESSSILAVNPNKTAAKIAVRVNSDWTAEAVSSTLENLRLDKTEGTSGWISLNLSFNENKGDDPRSAQIRFALKQYPEVTLDVTVTQKAGVVIEMSFAKGSTDWSPNLPTTYRTQLFQGKYKWLPSNYEVTFHVLQGDAFALYDATSLCFSVGAQAISWIEFPCLEDMALSNLYIHSSNTAGGQTYYVYDSIDNEGNRGNALAPSVKITHNEGDSSEASWGDTTPWTIEPEVGQTVYLYQSKQQNAKIDNITLIFTKK